MENRLGRGLDSLIASTVEAEAAPSSELLLREIRVNPRQPRRTMSEQALEGLATSIRHHGVLQPVVVRRVEGGFELVAGERRYRASQLAGKTRIPAMIVDAEGVRSLELALVENIQREDLGPLDEAAAYQQLLLQTGFTHQQLAERVGKTRATVSNALRLLDLPEDIKILLQQRLLSGGQARALLGVESEEAMRELAKAAAREQLSVREVEERVRAAKPTRAKVVRVSTAGAQPAGEKSAHYEEELRLLYGTKASIVGTPERGDVRLAYYSTQDRDRLLHALLTSPRGSSGGVSISREADTQGE